MAGIIKKKLCYLKHFSNSSSSLFQAIAKMEAELGHRINPEDDDEDEVMEAQAPADEDDLS